MEPSEAEVSARRMLLYTVDNTLKVVSEKDNSDLLQKLQNVQMIDITEANVKFYNSEGEMQQEQDETLVEFIKDHHNCIKRSDVPREVQQQYSIEQLIFVNQ